LCVIRTDDAHATNARIELKLFITAITEIMAVIENFSSIMRDMHVASGHKGETKTHKQIMEHYSHITMAAVKSYIANCERCA